VQDEDEDAGEFESRSGRFHPTFPATSTSSSSSPSSQPAQWITTAQGEGKVVSDPPVEGEFVFRWDLLSSSLLFFSLVLEGC
jgi:hypothetical protein